MATIEYRTTDYLTKGELLIENRRLAGQLKRLAESLIEHDLKGTDGHMVCDIHLAMIYDFYRANGPLMEELMARFLADPNPKGREVKP